MRPASERIVQSACRGAQSLLPNGEIECIRLSCSKGYIFGFFPFARALLLETMKFRVLSLPMKNLLSQLDSVLAFMRIARLKTTRKAQKKSKILRNRYVKLKAERTSLDEQHAQLRAKTIELKETLENEISNSLIVADKLAKRIYIASDTIDHLFRRLQSDCISQAYLRADKMIKHNSLRAGEGFFIKTFRNKFSPHNGKTAYQNFILELDCLGRINEVMSNNNEYEHFPILLGYDSKALTIRMSNRGRSIKDLREPILVEGLHRQVNNIHRILTEARVIHLDCTGNGKNLLINKSGILSLIDFDIAVANANPFSHKIVYRLANSICIFSPDYAIKILSEHPFVTII